MRCWQGPLILWKTSKRTGVFKDKEVFCLHQPCTASCEKKFPSLKLPSFLCLADQKSHAWPSYQFWKVLAQFTQLHSNFFLSVCTVTILEGGEFVKGFLTKCEFSGRSHVRLVARHLPPRRRGLRIRRRHLHPLHSGRAATVE